MHEAKALRLRWAANDMARHKGVTIALGVMLLLSAFLMVAGATVVERLTGSIDQLFEQAQPPHLLQMHTGEHDRDAVARFAQDQPTVEQWQIVDLLGYDGSALSWQRPGTDQRGDLSASLVDQLAVTQNERFDLLVDATGHAPRPGPGEVYLPMVHHQQYGVQTGDLLTIRTGEEPVTLTVKGFVRDAQMASSMASAIRFLVSPQDLDTLTRSGGASEEVIVEFRLSETSAVAQVQQAYEADESLPHNGQLVTHQMIVLVNAVSDGLVAVVLMMSSAALMAVALLNMRYVIRAALEADVTQIGALMAIGLDHRTIRRLYLARYRALCAAACVVGGLGGTVAAHQLVRTAQGGISAPLGPVGVIVPLVAAAAVHLIVIALCRGVLRQLRRVDVVTAMVHGRLTMPRPGRRRSPRTRRSRLVGVHRRTVNRRLALLDLRTGLRQWVVVPIVFAIATVTMVLPANVYATLSSGDFVTHLGAPRSDVRADIQWAEDADRARDELVDGLQQDPRVARVEVFAHVLRQVRGPEGPELLRVQVGDQAAAPIAYVSGRAPASGEIALSVLNAQRYGVVPGDRLELATDTGWQQVEVSGTYSDVTSGGLTSRMSGPVPNGAAGYVVHIDLVDGVAADQVAAEYDARIVGAKVIPMDAYVAETFASVTHALGVAVAVVAVFGVGVCALVVTVWLNLHLVRRRRSLGTMALTGFSVREILAQLRTSTVTAIVAGTLLGLVLAVTAGEALVSQVVAMVGVGLAGFEFATPTVTVWLALPVVLVVASTLAAVGVTGRLRRDDKSTWLV